MVRAVDMVHRRAQVEAVAFGNALHAEVQTGAQIEVLQAGVLQQQIFVGVDARVENAAVPLIAKVDLVLVESPLTERGRSAQGQEFIARYRQSECERDADLQGSKVQATLTVVIDHDACRQELVVSTFCEVQFIFHATRKGSIRYRYATPLAAVVSNEPQIAAEHTREGRAQVERRVANLRKMYVLSL